LLNKFFFKEVLTYGKEKKENQKEKENNQKKEKEETINEMKSFLF